MVKKLRQELNMKDPKLFIKKSASESSRVISTRNASNYSFPKRFASSEVVYFPNSDFTIKIERPELFALRKLTLTGSSFDGTKEDTNKTNTLNLNQVNRAESLSTPIDSSTLQNNTEISHEKNNFAVSTGNLDNSNKQKCSFLSISSSNDLNLKFGLLKNSLIVKSTSDNQNESKALQVLGVVFIVFIITWLPFCFLNMLATILEINNQSTIQFSNLVVYFTYLGYFQSTLNPIIYTIFNQKFRKNFIQIIKCQRKKHLNRNNAYLKSHRFKLKKGNSSLLIKRV